MDTTNKATFALYAPILDKFLYIDTDLEMMQFLVAVISSKIVTGIVRIDTATNFTNDVDRHGWLNYSLGQLPLDVYFFNIIILTKKIAYVCNGELQYKSDSEITPEIKELQDFLLLASKVKSTLDNTHDTFLNYVNDMSPELRLVTGKDLHSVRRNCYEILYAEKDITSAKLKIKNILVDIAL